MNTQVKAKLAKIVELVDKLMIDPDIDIQYCIPEVATTSDSCDLSGDPYISVTYAENKYVERKIRLTDTYLKNSPEEIAKLVTFSIEQFKQELDSVAIS